MYFALFGIDTSGWRNEFLFLRHIILAMQMFLLRIAVLAALPVKAARPAPIWTLSVSFI